MRHTGKQVTTSRHRARARTGFALTLRNCVVIFTVALHCTHAQPQRENEFVAPVISQKNSGKPIASSKHGGDSPPVNAEGYRIVSDEDDEIHDEEIMAAVQNSLRLWQQGKLNRSKTHNDTAKSRVKRDEEVVCYGAELGCFRDEGPFDYLDMLPGPPEEVGTKFIVYTRDSEPETFSFFNYTKLEPNVFAFNASRPTKVIIHGFGSTCLRMWANEMRTALLSVVDCNVICVDWENGAALPNYVRAAVNTRLVGKQLSLLIRKLVNDNPGVAKYEDFHLIGFSLGAHVAGFTGQELRNISRITGLDPAGPLFENYDKRVRLDSTDAIFVDVIHSNGDSLLMGGLGSWEPVGHLDFYPNGGRVQKGCSNLFLGAFRDFIWSPSGTTTKDSGSESRNGKSIQESGGETDGRSLCNHRRAYRFFTESVSPRCVFPAFSCESYEKFMAGGCFTWDQQLVSSAHMGYYADDHYSNPRSARQLQVSIPPVSKKSSSRNTKNFYLITRDDEPFCANQFKVTLESSPPLGIPISTYGGVEGILINANDDFNDTFLLTQSHKDNMIAGSVLQKLIVAHPAITEPSKVVLKYTAYKGWIYSGISRWSLDRIVVTNAFGISYSFCARGLLLPSGISVTVTLTKGICAVANFPFRYPFFHHHHHHLPLPHSPNAMQHLHKFGPALVQQNEINETSPLNYSPPLHSSSAQTNSSETTHEFIDWSNDWHPIILNNSSTAKPMETRNLSTEAPVTSTVPAAAKNSLDVTMQVDVDNAIDDSERRHGRQIAPLVLLPLSRAIEPRPVFLRSPRQFNFTSPERGRKLVVHYEPMTRSRMPVFQIPNSPMVFPVKGTMM